eukprot:COSAG01_NODE_7744_length_3075_cov_10.909946_1_plen_88_part_00
MPASHYRVADNVNRGRGAPVLSIWLLPGLLTGCAHCLGYTFMYKLFLIHQREGRSVVTSNVCRTLDQHPGFVQIRSRCGQSLASVTD